MMKIGVSGDAGSFSEEACLLYANRNNLDSAIKYLIDMEGVLAAVESGVVELGLFPVVNTGSGLVRMAFDAMGRHHFKVLDELWLEVHQCLLVKSGVARSQIKKIVSHPQALLQCRKYLLAEFPDAAVVESQDTAKSARELAADILSAESAVIAPARAAEVYGLDVMARDIQDTSPNLTAFIIVCAL